MTAWEAAAEWTAAAMREGRALHHLVADLDATQREGLRRVALVVLRPHVLAAGDGAPIVRHLAERLGARTVAIRVLPRLAPALVGELYARQAKIPRGRMWLQEDAFAMGPAAALLVACDEAPEPSLAAWLHARKGPSSALEAAPDSLRGRFGRTSSPHAVLHIPNDVGPLVVEASLFFSWETLVGAAQAPPLELGHVEALVTLEPTPGRLVFQAVAKIKLRILAAVAAGAGPEVVAPLYALTAAADAQLEGRSYLDQRARLLAFAEAERAPLGAAIDALAGQSGNPASPRRALRTATDPAELLIASWLLGGHEAYGHDGGERLFAVLEDGGVPLSAPQRSLLATALANDLNPAARRAGERFWPLGPDPAA